MMGRGARCRRGSAASSSSASAARQTERLVAGEDLIDAGPAPGPPDAGRPTCCSSGSTRICVAASSRMLAGPARATYLGLARLACEVGDDAPQAPVAASVAAMLDRLDRYAEEVGPRDGDRLGAGCRSRSRRPSWRGRPTCRCRRSARGTSASARRAPPEPARRVPGLRARGVPERGQRRPGAAARGGGGPRRGRAAGGRRPPRGVLRAPRGARASSSGPRTPRCSAARRRRSALTTCTTEGIATVVAGFGRGDTIVTSDEEHPGVYGPLAQARRRGAEIVGAPSSTASPTRWTSPPPRSSARTSAG